MSSGIDNVDAVVIGGGFYGCAIAIYLVKQRGFGCVVLVEKESQLLSRASYTNQARVHNGYHYPRSFTTAYRSRINMPRFAHDWPQAIKKDFTKLYAISQRNSMVTARQFMSFCHEIGAMIEPASENLRKLFNPNLIEAVFLVQEYAFDTTKLAQWAREELAQCLVRVELASKAVHITRSETDGLSVGIKHKGKEKIDQVDCHYVFNCTYSGLNQLKGMFAGCRPGLKHEITELALIEAPPELEKLGITVMDGPFFSMMPFPARNLHTLSHVRYTPHFSWFDKQGTDPYEVLDGYNCDTRAERMIRDVSRYLPAMARASYRDSLFEVKTILVKNDRDDGRPILYERSDELPGLFSVLGGKIDNIYDVLEKLDSEPLESLSESYE